MVLTKSDLQAIENIFDRQIDKKLEVFEKKFDKKLFLLEERLDKKLLLLEERLEKKFDKKLNDLKFAIFEEIARTHHYLKNYMDDTFVTKTSFELTLPTLLTQKEFHGTVDILMHEIQSLHLAFTQHEKRYH